MRGPAAFGVTLLVTINVVAGGIHATPHGAMAPLPPGAAVDYSPFRVALTPLQPEFIERILGESSPLDRASGARAPTQIKELTPPEPRARIVDDHTLTNDNLGQARVVPRPPFTAHTNSSQATRTSEDPSECGSVGGTVWYRYRSTIADGLIANTFGTESSTTLGVFEGSPGRWRNIGCDTDVQGNAVVVFAAQQGQDYYFQIASPAGGGPLVFSLELQGITTLESVSPSGEPGDNLSAGSVLSGNGRIVVFGSIAKNIVPGLPEEPCAAHPPYANSASNVSSKVTNGTNTCYQLFARDRMTGRTVLVTASPEGEAGNTHTGRAGQSSDDRTQMGGASVSYSGRYVAFASEATNLVADDRNTSADAFVRDLWTGRTEIVSRDSEGNQFSDISASVSWVSISGDGRFVVFTTRASTLLPAGEDTNMTTDVFLRDRLLGITIRVSVSSSGEQSELLADNTSVDNQGFQNFYPAIPCISANGRFIAFRSAASNLVDGDTNRMADIFVHDRIRRLTERVSLGPGGREANFQSEIWPGCISGDGRFVVFTSRATNLVEDDTNGTPDVFVHDRLLHVTRRVSVSSEGRQSETGDLSLRARVAVISANGRYVVFHSAASDLVEGDQNSVADVFVHDLVTGITSRVSSQPGGGEFTDKDAYNPSVSADGRFISFDAARAGVHVRSAEAVTPAQVYVHERVMSEP